MDALIAEMKDAGLSDEAYVMAQIVATLKSDDDVEEGVEDYKALADKLAESNPELAHAFVAALPSMFEPQLATPKYGLGAVKAICEPEPEPPSAVDAIPPAPETSVDPDRPALSEAEELKHFPEPQPAPEAEADVTPE